MLLIILFSTVEARTEEARPTPQLILPGLVLAGQPATLGVLSEGRPVAGAEVEFDTGERAFTDSRGHAHFQAPTGRMVITARLGETTATTTVLVAAPRASAERPEIESVARLLALGETASIRGRGFDGNADRDRVLLGSAEAPILAASPVVLVIALPPDVPLGAAELRVVVQGKTSNTRPVTLVALRIEAPSSLSPGQKVRPRVRVEGTTERMELEVTNRSPSVVRLEGGNERRVRSSGGTPNVAELKARALAAGSFSMSARIVTSPTGSPDVEYAKQLLDQARQLTDNSRIQERIAWILVQLDRQPVPMVAVTREINRVLGSFPMTVPLGKALEAARDALEGR